MSWQTSDLRLETYSLQGCRNRSRVLCVPSTLGCFYPCDRRNRTNIGIAELSGKPATVEVSIVLPDSRITPVLRYELGANEYRQDATIQQLGIGNVYNARVSVKVIGGEGRVTAYGSVIDKITQDSTYVPAAQ